MIQILSYTKGPKDDITSRAYRNKINQISPYLNRPVAEHVRARPVHWNSTCWRRSSVRANGAARLRADHSRLGDSLKQSW